MNNKIVYTVKEVSQLLHTNTAYIYTLIHAGLLPAIKLGSYKIREESLETFLKNFEGKDLTNANSITQIPCHPFVTQS